MPDVPAYRELPAGPQGGRLGWHVFSEVGLGTMAHQTAESVLEAVRTVELGQVFPLDLTAGAIDPPMFGRSVPRHEVIQRPDGFSLDDRLLESSPQGGSHWDALAHVAYAPGQFYEGRTLDEVVRGDDLGIHRWADRGIVGRGVVLDLEAAVGEVGRAYHPAKPVPFHVADLELAVLRSGAALQPGDILMIRTGYLSWYRRQEHGVRRAAADSPHAAGLAHDEAVAEWLWDAKISAVVSDSPAVEVLPIEAGPQTDACGYLHRVLIGGLGLALGEFWWLDDLLDGCRRKGRFDCLVTSAPVNQTGGIGSPANALAII